jgi:hypothetical protein
MDRVDDRAPRVHMALLVEPGCSRSDPPVGRDCDELGEHQSHAGSGGLDRSLDEILRGTPVHCVVIAYR